jgi:uncharacterized UBP type Zn finger protein
MNDNNNNNKKMNNNNNNNNNNNSVNYTLCGIVVHHGTSVRSGHYVAYIKAPNNQW